MGERLIQLQPVGIVTGVQCCVFDVNFSEHVYAQYSTMCIYVSATSVHRVLVAVGHCLIDDLFACSPLRVKPPSLLGFQIWSLLNVCPVHPL